MSTQGLLPVGIDRFDVVEAYAIFSDWWNSGGLTDRCRDKKRSISSQLWKMGYQPGVCDPSLKSWGAQEVYLGLVEHYHPESLQEEVDHLKELYPEEQ